MTVKHVITAALVFCAASAFADSYVWIIGGGPKKKSSEKQIERNVKWAGDVIKNNSPETALKIFYTDGDDPEPDVVEFIGLDEAGDNYVLDMIFGGPGFHPSVYSNHTVISDGGSTQPGNLVPVLEKDFSMLQPGDRALVLYNGHGWGNSSDYGLNTLRLWTEKGLTVYDFEKLLDNIDDSVPVRFVLTQCYSGGFARLIHPEARADTMKLKGNRCGFMAESATREAEGCSASLTVGEYRDYTTFMFAALDGKTRLGSALDYDPDINGDKEVSLREAHLYTLVSAYSKDLSRSTTEYYLEKWEPWYLRWIPAGSRSKNSVFYRVLSKVLANNRMSPGLSEVPVALRAERLKRAAEFNRLLYEMAALKKAIKDTQNSIIADLKRVYPDIQNAYNAGFKIYTEQARDDARSLALQSGRLADLREYFNEKDRLDRVLLDAERSLAQIDKVARMKKLARLDAFFPVFASADISKNYHQLLACEESVF